MADLGKMVSVCGPNGEACPGLMLSLDDVLMAKLGLDPAAAEIGSELHLFALARVVVKHSHEHLLGGDKNVVLQITNIAIESEDAENEQAEEQQEDEGRGWYDKDGDGA